MKAKTIEALKSIRKEMKEYQNPMRLTANILSILDTLIENEEQEDLSSIIDQPEELTQEEVEQELDKIQQRYRERVL